MLEINQVSFSYDADKSFQFDGIKSSSEPTLILGPSGCGKTTLLHLMAGLLKPKSGSVLWDSKDIHSLGSKKLDQWRGENLSIVFQKSRFIQAWNVLENIKSQAHINNKSINSLELESLLERLNIAHLSIKKTNELSEGEKQRVSIARALIHRPKYLLADEPTSALDDHNAFEVIDLLTQEAKNFGAQVMVITHDQRLKDKISNRIEL